MNYWQAAILGLVEGISEFLPISSTGHLILAERVLRLASSEFVKSFDIAIQLGAILAVIVLYGKRMFLKKEIWLRVGAAFLPTAFLGFLLYKVIKKFLLGNELVVVWSLLLGGIFLIFFEKIYREKDGATGDLKEITYPQALWIGIFQSLAMVPGVSRAAATIIGGLILGLKRKTIVEFSFLLAVPTMAAATALDLLKSGSSFSSEQYGLLAVGFLVSFGVAIVSIKFLLHFIQRHNFVSFGIYRILVAVGFIILK